MRLVRFYNPCSTLTLTWPLLFAPHCLRPRRERLLRGFPLQRSPFLLRPLLPVPLEVLQAPPPLPAPLEVLQTPPPLPRLPPSLLPRGLLLQPLRRPPRQLLSSLRSRHPHWQPPAPSRSHRSGSRPDRFCPPSFRRFRESPSIVPGSSTRASRRN